MNATDLAKRLHAKKSGTGWIALCPAHDDHNPSLSISEDRDGRMLVHCFAGCKPDVVLRLLGLTKSNPLLSKKKIATLRGETLRPASPTNKLHPHVDDAMRAACWSISRHKGKKYHEVARWRYHNIRGEEVAFVGRFEPKEAPTSPTGKPQKEYRPTHRDGIGWRVGDPPGLWPLYQLQEITKGKETVYICEGEKACDAGRQIGLMTTTSAHGAKSPEKTDWQPLAGRSVIILPDNDAAGQGYAQKVLGILSGLTPPATAKIANLPGLPPKGDLADFIADNDAQTAEELCVLIQGLGNNATPTCEVSVPNIGAVENPIQLAMQGQPLQKSDLGFAERFAYHHKDKAIFQSDAQVWLVWDGKRWKPDRALVEMRKLAAQTARSIRDECSVLPAAMGIYARAQHYKFALRCESKDRINAAIQLAPSCGLSLPLAAFDRNPMLLNVANGTVDLRTGCLRPHGREDYLTKLSLVSFEAGCHDEIFKRFIGHVTAGDEAFEAYLRRAAGYTLTGTIGEKCLFMIYSELTDTGKTTFISGLQTTMGEYALTLDFELLLSGERSFNPRYDLAKLYGVRLAVAAESEAGRKFSPELIKRLTGGDAIRAREIREASIEFLPTHKLWLSTNHAPYFADGGDEATWNRLRRVPFNNQIQRAVRDPHIKGALEDPASPTCRAFLAWTVAGCLEWQRSGLGSCSAVDTSTAAYREETDPVVAFLEDRCRLDRNAEITVKELRDAYENWCTENGERYPLNRHRFAACLRKHGLLSDKGTGVT